MDIDIRTVTIILIWWGYALTLGVTAYYGFRRPWYRYSEGRILFFLLLSITLLLTNTIIRLVFPGAVPSWVGLLLFGVYMVAIAGIGVGIYQAPKKKRKISDNAS